MPQYLVTAEDGTDPAALDRRMATRPAHMERVEPFARDGTLVIGIAKLDGAGRMVGSVLVLDLPDEKSVHAWLQDDPYTKAGVWQRFVVAPCRTAPLPYGKAA